MDINKCASNSGGRGMNKEIEKAIDFITPYAVSGGFSAEEKGYFKAAITALEAHQADRWIPVTSGRLPELGLNVKVTWRTHDVFEHTNEDETEIAYRNVNFPHDWTLSRSNQRVNVVAWKSLDEPWEEEQP
ncbi:MAG: hypothetical protein K0S61_4343 [Anaerocolumna sp.]|jgi:hypothetical protein|nr:hypothetical protein [Anaerocolumna sp.]